MEFAADFKKLVSQIEPGSSEVTDARDAHEKVRKELQNDKDSKDAHKDSFLSGSYARSTAINDINDVDVIWILDIDPKITDTHTLIAWTQAILNRYYTEVRLQGRSVGVKAAKGVWLDIVPSSPVSDDAGPLWIPDRDAKEWVITHPKGQIAAKEGKNKTTNGYYVQVVKLMKFWRDRLPTKSCRPKSYILETLCYQSIGTPFSHAQGIVNVLEGIEINYGIYRSFNSVPTIADPGYPAVNVAKRWPFAEFSDFMNQVKTAADIARRALQATDEAESKKLWRQLLGSQFGS
jgi:hypothetical protein